MDEPLADRRIVLGVASDLAACDSPAVCSGLVRCGAQVDVVLCAGAETFVPALTYQALTHRRVYTSMFDLFAGENIPHVALAGAADLVLMAPATGAALSRLANGLADELFYAIALASPAPIVLAASAPPDLWQHADTRRHIETLREWGVEILPPPSEGAADGAMLDVAEILGAARAALRADPHAPAS
ncbi:MAG: hypothetical protein JSU66_15255 [Deltaproteobacteria bacterium]|nr:MAG: hypothetical protein JSU66_15255 [Deltaproteobacteria bacterium]